MNSKRPTLHDPTTLQVPLAVAVETLRHAGEADPFCIPWEALKPLGLRDRRMRPRLKQSRPNCGKVLLHAKLQSQCFRENHGVSLCCFKIGVTANPCIRYVDYLQRSFTAMWIIHEADDVGLVHMLEAALISHFQHLPGCKNEADSGCEGALNHHSARGPPYYVYITGGRADQGKWVG